LPLPASPITPDNLSQLVEVGRWGKGSVLEAAYSPDGSRLYVLTEQGVYLYDAATATQLAFHPNTNHPNHMALSPDGRILAISTNKYPYYYVELRDANNFNFLAAFFPFEQSTRRIYKLVFDRSSQYLIIGGQSFVRAGNAVTPIVTVWDVNNLNSISEIEAPYGFDFAPQADIVVTNDGGGTLHIWDWQNPTFVERRTVSIPGDMEVR
jgi:WD40 repeat protein